MLGGIISQLYGWRVAFFAMGIPGMVLAVIFLFTVREPQRWRWESPGQGDHKPTLAKTVQVLSFFRSFWYLTLATGLTALAGYGTSNFAPSFLIRNHGFTAGEVGIVLAIFGGGGGMIGTFLGGYLSDRLGVHDKR